MQSTPLTWHPKYRVCNITAKDLLLVSTEQQFLLKYTDYPLCHMLDGNRTIDDIVQTVIKAEEDNSRHIGRFLTTVKQFQASGLLVSTQEARRVKLESSAKGELKHLGASVYSTLSARFNQALLPLLSQLSTPQGIELVFVCSLLHPQLKAVLEGQFTNLVLIVCQEQQVMLSPVLNCRQDFELLQQRLLHNNPVIKYLYHMHVKQWEFPACVRPDWLNEQSTVQGMAEKISSSLSCDPEQLCSIDKAGQVTNYPLYLQQLRTSAAFAEQLMQPVELSDSDAQYSDDGGFRSLSPAETVEKLAAYVNPVVGYITHMEELLPATGKPVKTYSCSFFKTPPVADLSELDTDSFVQVCLGKGVSQQQSQASALCETVERLNAQFTGDEPLLFAKPGQLDKPCVSFHDLAPYSENQYQQFAETSAAHRSNRLQLEIEPYNNQAIYWLPSWSLTKNEQVYVPTACCFANIEMALVKSVGTNTNQVFDDDKFGRWHSNGAAAGNSLEEAILQALLELIERDAVAIWWYNQIERPEFDLSRLEPDKFNKLRQTITACGDPYDFWVLDLTHDLGIPVMTAIGKHKVHRGFILGFGCHFTPELAAQRALTELCQLIPVRKQQPDNSDFNFDAIADRPYLYPNNKAKSVDPTLPVCNNLKQNILAIVTKLQQVGLETLVLDYSRAPLPLHTAKVFVPGLCHIWPQLRNQRLYQVPVTMGWQKQENNEESINQQGLYI